MKRNISVGLVGGWMMMSFDRLDNLFKMLSRLGTIYPLMGATRYLHVSRNL